MDDFDYTMATNPKQGKLISSEIGDKLGRWQVLDEIHHYKEMDHKYYTLQAPNWAIIVPYTDDEIYLTWQYRAAWRRSSLEFPAGKLEDDEDPLLGAQRELKEETGLIGESWELLATLRPISWSTQLCYVFATRVIGETSTNFDDSEDILTVKFQYGKLMSKIKNGDMVDIPSISAFHLFINKF